MDWNVAAARRGDDQPMLDRLPKQCVTCPVRETAICGAAGLEGTRQFGKAARRVDLDARDRVFTQGDTTRHLFTIVAGVVRLAKDLPDGREQGIGFAVPGHVLGLRPGAAIGHSAAAITPARLCKMSWSQLEGLLDRFPPMERRLREIVAAELEAAQDHMLTLGRKTARERVATFLLDLPREDAAPADGLGPTAVAVALPMSRTDIADHLGLRIETVSRTFTEFSRLGLIRQYSLHRLEVLNTRRLAALAGGEA